MSLSRLIARLLPHRGQDAAESLGGQREELARTSDAANKTAVRLILAAHDQVEAMDATRHRITARSAGREAGPGRDAVVAATASVAELARKHR